MSRKYTDDDASLDPDVDDASRATLQIGCGLMSP
jgi:hypothetical protein